LRKYDSRRKPVGSGADDAGPSIHFIMLTPIRELRSTGESLSDTMPLNMSCRFRIPSFILVALTATVGIWSQTPAPDTTVLHAARLLDIDSGHIVSPGEVLVKGERIVEAGTTVKHPAGSAVIDLGDRTLLPGLIDAHIHLFLHPGAEDLQTVQESVPQRTIVATLAARDDLMAGFTAERDMGTEGAGSADTAVRDAIDRGEIPGPRLRISGNAINILGGHEDAIGYNPAQHVLPNADFANNAEQLIEVMREQFKQGSDFAKIYETGADSVHDGILSSPYQYTEAELSAAVREAARVGKHVAVHATDDPGALYAARAGVASVDHSFQLGDETMRIMHEKHIFAVPTFTIQEYFAAHPLTAGGGPKEQAILDLHAQNFRKQLAAGVPIAMGSDVGPFPHGTQARELELMVKFGMTPLGALQADLINGAKLLDWEGQIGTLKPGHFADIIAVPGNPLNDITALQHVEFVMKGGTVYKRP
jgi:imidazolonepropionase-like amidohydrolase